MENGARLRIPVNAVVKIFIDSPSRSGSSCASGGTISAGNDVQINREFGLDAAARATQLDVFVHGRTNPDDSMANPDVNFDSNNLMFYGTLYAPNSFVNVWNNGEMVGGFVGENIDFKNGAGFVYPSSIVNKELPGFKGTIRKGWFECTPTPTNPADPESGCVP
jgi:hypothetical protein